jgi:hypothetical protein
MGMAHRHKVHHAAHHGHHKAHGGSTIGHHVKPEFDYGNSDVKREAEKTGSNPGIKAIQKKDGGKVPGRASGGRLDKRARGGKIIQKRASGGGVGPYSSAKK